MSMLVPGIISAYFVCIAYDVFIPIMGRIGQALPADYVIAGMVFVTIVLFSFYSVSLVYVTKKPKQFVKIFGALSLFALVLSVSGVMFQYSSENPVSPKKIHIQHISRTFYDQNRAITKQDSGIWFQSWDVTGVSPFKDNQYIKKAAKVTCEGVYCGYPYYLPVRALMRDTWYLRASSPGSPAPHSFKITKREVTEDRTIRVHIEVTGPDHMTMYITPKDGTNLTKWSLTDGTPLSKPSHIGSAKEMCHFVFYSHGYHSGSWEFFLEFATGDENPAATSGVALADLAMSYHYVHGKASETDMLLKITESLPPWAVETAWVSNYESFVL